MCAWTTKSERFGGVSSPTSAGRLGPGQYNNNKTNEAEPSYAPFGSTNPRGTSNKEGGMLGFVSPGAGSYDPKLPSTYDPGLPKRYVPFSSSATRIQGKAKMDYRPGPGNYKVDPDLGPAQASRTMGTVPSGKVVLRSSSAPSIPRNHQSFGYEEIGNGRLVRQGPKDGTVFLSGRPEDSAGPGQYQVELEPVAPRAKNGAFLQGAARVPLQTGPADVPGPGHYKAKPAIDMEALPFRMGSSFASASERGQTKKQQQRSAEGPGPTSYNQNKPLKQDLREMRSELQYFGSTVERFKQAPNERSCVPVTLGPGTYPLPGSVKLEGPNVRGFCSTTSRFRGDIENVNPGPGTYESQGITDESMTGPLSSFSMLSNQGSLAFGTMSKRITYPRDDKPGPGEYPLPGMSDFAENDTVEENPRGRSRRPKISKLPGAAFASQTPKDMYSKSLVKEGLQRPPPGAYDPVLVKDQATVVRLRSKSEGFLSASHRFPGHAPVKGYHATVGPGKYMPQAVTGGKKIGTFNRAICDGMPEGGRPQGLGFDNQDKRFKTTVPAKQVPGPGSYNTEKGWITKSHNCYFGDLT